MQDCEYGLFVPFVVRLSDYFRMSSENTTESSFVEFGYPYRNGFSAYLEELSDDDVCHSMHVSEDGKSPVPELPRLALNAMDEVGTTVRCEHAFRFDSLLFYRWYALQQAEKPRVVGDQLVLAIELFFQCANLFLKLPFRARSRFKTKCEAALLKHLPLPSEAGKR